MRVRVTSRSPEETERLGREVGESLLGEEIIALTGELGTGKTLFVRGLAQGIGSEDDVASPTFIYIRRYHGRLPLKHVDLYRISRPEDVEAIGLFELAEKGEAIAIEWADRAGPLLPEPRLDISFRESPGGREIVFSGEGRYLPLLKTLLDRGGRSLER